MATLATVATGTGVYEVIVISESDLAWRVVCQAPDCLRTVDVPKSRNGLSPRGCIDHPPHTWKKA